MKSAVLLTHLAIGTFAAGASSAADAPKPDPRPNILFCIADDWSFPHAGIHGDKVVKTPTFDKLASEGMVFLRSYCAAPTCTASRGAILTGQTPHRLEAGADLWSALPGKFKTYPDLLEAAGYVIGLEGKGWGPGSLEGTGRTRNPAGPAFKGFAEFLKTVPADKPFCYWYGSRDPHRPYVPGQGIKAGLKPEDVVVPPFLPDTPEVRSDLCDYYFAVQRFDRDVGTHLQQLADSGRAGNTIVVITSDNGMPFPCSKANLYEYGTHMPLAIRWPGKVKAGGSTDAFVSHCDFAPTFLEAAGLKPEPDMTGRSLMPLLTGQGDAGARDSVFVERERHANVRAGDKAYPIRAVRTAKYVYIRNLRPELWPAGDPVLHFAVGPYGDIDGGPSKDVVVKLKDAGTDQAKFFRLACGKRPEEELYDVEADPHQLNNISDRPEHAAAKAKLRAELDAWMTRTADPRVGPEGGDDRFDKYKYFGGPMRETAGKNK